MKICGNCKNYASCNIIMQRPIGQHPCAESLNKEMPACDLFTAKPTDRENLETLVRVALDEGIITMSRAREYLGFQYIEELRKWLIK